MTKQKLSTKRAGYLYEKICDIENIKAAIRNASKKKRKQRNVKRILLKIDHYADIIRNMLLDMSYQPSEYIVKMINDGIRQKRRKIAKPRFFPDQCIHHALIQVIEPCIMKGMYHYCCGSVKGRGDKRIRKAIRKYIQKKPNKAKYVLKTDVHHFYESINHDQLKAVIRKKIKDRRVLWLCDAIIDSYPYGIPIGNYTSQWFCNLFLEDLDHKIKAFLGRDYMYTRYIDDMVAIGPNKRKLSKLRKMIERELKMKGLQMKENWQVFKLKARTLDFVGVKFHSDGIVTLRKTILKRIKRKARKIQKLTQINSRNASGMISYMGWIKISNSVHLYQKEIKERGISIKKLRRIVSYETRVHRETTGNLVGSAA